MFVTNFSAFSDSRKKRRGKKTSFKIFRYFSLSIALVSRKFCVKNCKSNFLAEISLCQVIHLMILKKFQSKQKPQRETNLSPPMTGAQRGQDEQNYREFNGRPWAQKPSHSMQIFNFIGFFLRFETLKRKCNFIFSSFDVAISYLL